MKTKSKLKFPAHVEFGRSKSGRGKGKWRLRTRAENGNILMTTSEGYCNQAEMFDAVMASVDAILRDYAMVEKYSIQKDNSYQKALRDFRKASR